MAEGGWGNGSVSLPVFFLRHVLRCSGHLFFLVLETQHPQTPSFVDEGPVHSVPGTAPTQNAPQTPLDWIMPHSTGTDALGVKCVTQSYGQSPEVHLLF